MQTDAWEATEDILVNVDGDNLVGAGLPWVVEIQLCIETQSEEPLSILCYSYQS